MPRTEAAGTTLRRATTDVSWRRQTPLGLITLFVSLSETVLGAVTTLTSGTVQMLLTLFVVTFPALIAGAFFVVLWNRPHHLYHPSEFGGGTTAEAFERATRPRLTDLDAFRDLLRRMVDGYDGDRAKALVSAVAVEFTDMEPFITAQYGAQDRLTDPDGSKAKKLLQRLIVLRVRDIDDIRKWQSATEGV
jgi:hypothetical protein